MIIFKKLFIFFIFLLFCSYYIIAIAVNFPWINGHIQPLTLFNAKKFTIVNKQIALSTYPTFNDLKNYKQMGYKEIVTILDPLFPMSRELVKAEKKNCQKLGLKFMVLPIDFHTKSAMDYVLVRNMILNENKKTVINAYFFDKRIRILRNVMKNR